MPLHRSRGFTLPELVTVMAIMALLAVVALPALVDALAGYRLKATGEALITSLNRARATAIRRGHLTRACPSQDGRACSSEADWSEGWIARDEDTHTLFDVSDIVPRRVAAARRPGRHHIDFQPDGSASGNNQSITLCLRRKPHSAFSIVISNAGRIRRDTASRDDASACSRRPSRNT